MSYTQLAQDSLLALEPFVTAAYFLPETTRCYESLGLVDRQGYFCVRSAPLGRQPGQVIAAAFYNFNPQLVIKSLEGGWRATTPHTLLAARLQAVEEGLSRVLAPQESEEDLSAVIEPALELVKKATTDLPLAGRILYAAHVALPWPENPLTALWHGANLFREYRGDVHNVALLAHEVDPVECLLLQAAYSPRLTLERLLKTRGWSTEVIESAQTRLTERGLLKDNGLTERGKEFREQIEQLTNRLDSAPFEALGEADSRKLLDLLEPLSNRILARGLLPYTPKPA